MTSWELGGKNNPWTTISVEGTARFTDVAPAVSFRTTVGGATVWLGIKEATTGQIFETLQVRSATFLPWTLIPGLVTDLAPVVSDGNLAVGHPTMAAVAKGGVTAINNYLGDQPQNPPPPNYWLPLRPPPITAFAPAIGIVRGGAAGPYMFLAATVIDFAGPNGDIQFFQGSPFSTDNLSIGGGGFESNISPAMASAHNRTVIVAVDPNGALCYNWWDFGGGGHGWVPLGDEVRTTVAPAISLVDNGNYMFVFAQGLDGELYINQANVGGTIIGWGRAE